MKENAMISADRVVSLGNDISTMVTEFTGLADILDVLNEEAFHGDLGTLYEAFNAVTNGIRRLEFGVQNMLELLIEEAMTSQMIAERDSAEEEKEE